MKLVGRGCGWVLLVLACAWALTGCGEDDGGDNGAGDTSGSSGADTSSDTSGTSGTSGADTLSDTSGGDTSGASGCGAVTPEGQCDGTVLTWCDEDENGDPAVATYDCAEQASACGLINSTYGYDCIVPAGGDCDSFSAPFCAGAGAACVFQGDTAGEVCVENSALTCNASQDAPACQGDTLVYECVEGHTVIATDCAAIGSVCQVVEEVGTCVTAAGGDCSNTFSCGGTNPACVAGVGGEAVCVELTEALTCDPQQTVPTCAADRLVTGCNLGTLSILDCAALGGTCNAGDPAADGAFCEGVTEGNICEEGIVNCATGFTCTDPASGEGYSTCQPDAPTPPPTP